MFERSKHWHICCARCS